jgi:uncharacterized membrane protein
MKGGSEKMTARTLGLVIGFALGVVWVAFGFGAALLVAVLAFLGWLVGGIAEGQINVVTLWEDLQGRRRDLI